MSLLSAKSMGRDDAQASSIFRVRHWSELHRYCSNQPKLLSDQFGLAVFALKEN